MSLQLRAVRIGDLRAKGEGLRLGTVRYLPRGVRKQDYAARDLFDVWLPTLAPSRELLHALKTTDLSPKTFFARYRREMSETEPRQVIRLLAELAQRTPIAVSCYCADASKCHRSVLVELIRKAAGL